MKVLLKIGGLFFSSKAEVALKHIEGLICLLLREYRNPDEPGGSSGFRHEDDFDADANDCYFIRVEIVLVLLFGARSLGAALTETVFLIGPERIAFSFTCT